MSVTLMAASCDSIGSCSLDVDAESLNGSIVESAQVDSTNKHRNAGDLKANAPSLSQQTLHSLLLSTGTDGSGQNSENLDSKTQINFSAPSSTTVKKPSYLSLACSISGYGGITTYDSKLREGFRSRDHSPGKLVNLQSASREISPARAPSTGNFLSAPKAGRLCWVPGPGTDLPKSDMKHISSIGGGQRVNGRNGADQTDTANVNMKRIFDQRNRWLESTLSPDEDNKDYHKVVSVFETRSGRHGHSTETSVETRYEINSKSQSTFVSSTTVISSNSHSPHFSSSLQTERTVPISVDRNGHQIGCQSNGSSSHLSSISSKSFIQQRIERLYGPCALAQGFYHKNEKSIASSSFSIEESRLDRHTTSDAKTTAENSDHAPELPVLRHLRPEFRDQLIVAPRKSFGSRVSNGSPSNPAAMKPLCVSDTAKTINSGQCLQHQTSTESIVDQLLAAPEVVLPQQPPLVCSLPEMDVSCPEKKTDINGSATISPEKQSQSGLDKSISISSLSAPSVSHSLSLDGEREENAGHKFLKIQRETIEKLIEQAEKAEREIQESGSNGKSSLSEEALGHLRSAAGKARLLVTQKMVQFEGLCHKCINQHPGEPFPTTAEDLQGFWDMLLLQVDQVHDTFRHLEKLRAVNWCEEKLDQDDLPKSSDSAAPHVPNSGSKRTLRTSKSTPASAAKSAEAAALRKQREDDRRRMMEQRRRELKQKQEACQDTTASKDSVEIFGAQSR